MPLGNRLVNSHGPGSGAPPTAGPTTSVADPRIEDLKRALAGATGRLSELSTPYAIKRPDFSQYGAQTSQVQGLLAQLMRGEGVQYNSDVSADPQAKAFRVAKLREAEGLRAGEADRLGASGLSGSGDFDARTAQIRESAGTDIAGYEAGLVGERRRQATEGAITGANLTLADLDRQARNEQDRFDADRDLEAARRSGLTTQVQTELGTNQTLLSQLMGEDARRQELERLAELEATRQRERDEDIKRAKQTDLSRLNLDNQAAERLAAELRRQEERRRWDELQRQNAEANARRLAEEDARRKKEELDRLRYPDYTRKRIPG